jgi:serine protease Do
LVERVKPAVVTISTTGSINPLSWMQGQGFQLPEFPEGSPLGDLFQLFHEGVAGLQGGGNAQRNLRAVGSGFILSGDGYVVTNNHMIDNADRIEVILNDGARYSARVKGRDPGTNLALLKIEADKPLPYVTLGDSDNASIGDWVIAVGNPSALGGTVTAGIISARSRDTGSSNSGDLLQIDTPLNRGNSGGPLFDTLGGVIGINTSIRSPMGGIAGVGFFISSAKAGEIIAQLKMEGRVAHGWLGVHIQPVTEEVAESLGLKEAQGALVASVAPDSPADRAGIRSGDVIVRMNGEILGDFKELSKRVAKARAGSESTFEVLSNGKMRKLEVELGRMPGDKGEVTGAVAAEASSLVNLGISFAELTPEARQRYDFPGDAEGVLVAGVQPGSPAAKAGIRTGSLISMVGQEPVLSAEIVVEKVKQAADRGQSSLLLLVEHGGEKRFVTVKLALP